MTSLGLQREVPTVLWRHARHRRFAYRFERVRTRVLNPETVLTIGGTEMEFRVLNITVRGKPYYTLTR